MKKIFFALILSLLFIVPSHAQEYDVPYYMGFVTAEGGTVHNDKIWIVEEKRGSDNDFPFVWYDSPASAKMIHSYNGYILNSSWYYNSENSWVLDATEIFLVDNDYYYFCGKYDHVGDYYIVPDKKIRFKRRWSANELMLFPENYTVSHDNSTVAITMAAMIVDGDVTLPASKLPISSDLAGCLAWNLVTWEPGCTISEMRYYCPNRPGMLIQDSEFCTPDSGDGLKEFEPDSLTKVQSWGTGPSYYSSFTSDAQITTIHGKIDTVPIPSGAKTATGSSGGAVVIPLM